MVSALFPLFFFFRGSYSTGDEFALQIPPPYPTQVKEGETLYWKYLFSSHSGPHEGVQQLDASPRAQLLYPSIAIIL